LLATSSRWPRKRPLISVATGSGSLTYTSEFRYRSRYPGRHRPGRSEAASVFPGPRSDESPRAQGSRTDTKVAIVCGINREDNGTTADNCVITLRCTQGIQLSLQRSAGHPRMANLQRLG
jgi:hypothetical protein